MIDEKGKIFGIINIIDLIVVVVLVLIVGGVAYKTFSSKSLSSESNVKEVTVQVRARLKAEEAAKALKPGDKLVAKNTYVNGVIDSVDYTDGDYVVQTAEGGLMLQKHPIWKDVYVTVKGRTDVGGPIIVLGGQEIRIGREYWVKTQQVEMLGEVIDIEIKE